MAPLRRYRHPIRLAASLRELVGARAIVRRLAARELRVRYRRAFLGFGWAVVTPVALLLAFSLVLTRAAKISTQGAPYPLFAYLGLLPWSFFSSSVAQGSASLLNNMTLLKRTYLPREVFPISSLLVGLVDLLVASVVLMLLFPIHHFVPHATAYWIPLYFLIQLAFTAGVVLFLAAATVYVRDLRHVMSLALQVGLFATPVAYGLTAIPAQYRALYVGLNPLATVIDGYRRAVLFGQGPNWQYVLISGTTALAVLVAGYLSFKKMEAGVADIS